MVGHGEKECAEGKQAQQVVDWKVKLPSAVSAAAVILCILLPFCGKFTQLNLFFQGMCAGIAYCLLCFCSEYHQWATFIIALLEISIQRVSERSTTCLYIWKWRDNSEIISPRKIKEGIVFGVYAERFSWNAVLSDVDNQGVVRCCCFLWMLRLERCFSCGVEWNRRLCAWDTCQKRKN